MDPVKKAYSIIFNGLYHHNKSMYIKLIVNNIDYIIRISSNKTILQISSHFQANINTVAIYETDNLINIPVTICNHGNFKYISNKNVYACNEFELNFNDESFINIKINNLNNNLFEVFVYNNESCNDTTLLYESKTIKKNKNNYSKMFYGFEYNIKKGLYLNIYDAMLFLTTKSFETKILITPHKENILLSISNDSEYINLPEYNYLIGKYIKCNFNKTICLYNLCEIKFYDDIFIDIISDKQKQLKIYSYNKHDILSEKLLEIKSDLDTFYEKSRSLDKDILYILLDNELNNNTQYEWLYSHKKNEHYMWREKFDEFKSMYNNAANVIELYQLNNYLKK